MAFIDHTGEVNKANNGMLMTIINYRNSDDLDIQFEDGTIVTNKTHQSFKNGAIKHPNIAVSEYTKFKGKSKPCIVFGITYESFKDACESFNVNDVNATSYKNTYKITEEQAIDHYINGTDYSNLDKVNGVRITKSTKIVIIDNVKYNYKQAFEKYQLSPKGVDKVMNEYKLKDRGEAIIFCIKHGLAKRTRKQSGEIIVRGMKFSSLKYALKHFRIAEITYRKYKEELETEDYTYIIECILNERDKNSIKTNKGNFPSFSALADFLGISTNNINTHSETNSRQDKINTITKIIKGAYINTEGTLVIPDNIVLNIVKKDKVSDEHKKFLSYCKILGIDIQIAGNYKRNNPELTNEQIIKHYRPDCYINIFGELVIPEGN